MGRSTSAVCLEVDGDDLPGFGELRQVRAEHLARPDSAVKQDQGLSFSMNLVVEFEAVYLGVTAFGVVVHFAFSFSDRVAWARPALLFTSATSRCILRGTYRSHALVLLR
jgi:hypothetical protein